MLTRAAGRDLIVVGQKSGIAYALDPDKGGELVWEYRAGRGGGRTAKRLLDMADGEDEFTLPVTQEELAGMVGASRERVNKAIASFVRLGWIDQTERRYTILDREQLTRRAR